MATLNKLMLIGRLTRDPECRTFANGGKVAKFGFAVNERRKNQQTGQWEDGDPMFIDCSAFNRGDFGKLADTVEKFLRKGSQCYLEGRLKLDQWDDKSSGAKRSKHEFVVEVMQMLDARQGGEGGGPQRSGPASSGPQHDYQADDGPSGPAPAGGNEEIPF